MELTQVLAIVGANIATITPMFLWLRSEGNADRREIFTMMREMKEETKDFHGRLCALDERGRK